MIDTVFCKLIIVIICMYFLLIKLIDVTHQFTDVTHQTT